MSEKPFCYLFKMGEFDDDGIEPTIQDLIKTIRYSDKYKNVNPSFWLNRSIYARFAGGREEKICSFSDFLQEIALSEDDIKQIESEIDLQIERDEESLRSLFLKHPGATMTGCFGMRRSGRNDYVKEEMEARSWAWNEDAISKIEN